jgi:hypothetical protein
MPVGKLPWPWRFPRHHGPQAATHVTQDGRPVPPRDQRGATWSDAFGGAPIYLHMDDREWVMRTSPSIVHWTGQMHPLSRSLTLIRCGGHFPGGAMMHWSDGAGGQGALFAGDIATVAMNRRRESALHPVCERHSSPR